MTKRKAVVIGCGAIGPIHAAAIVRSADAELYGVCDIVEARAATLAEQYQCRTFTAYEDVLADPAIDSVHICTPHYLHAEMAIHAARAGKHIVLEKPIALNLVEARTIKAVVKETGVACCTVLQNRLNPSVEKAKEWIAAGKLGNMLGIKGFLTWRRTAEYYHSEAWRGKWATEGGGLLINQALHMLDLMSYLGGEITATKGNIDTRVLQDCIEVEDTADATLYYKDGKTGLFFATNGHSQDSPFFIEMHMEKGIIRYMDNQLTVRTDSGSDLLATDEKTVLGKAYWGSGHALQIGSFYRSLAEGGCNYPGLEDAAASLGLLLAIYKSSKTRKKEQVETL
ncbi:Gfo/Idh/MocA family protein [Gorillibacterium massiliense]|uniref:Gfo/Idh/MocA family protein n=1 Tax=Gorillibacterium massiliense TaxID=1280390 RepID=UPI0004B5CC1A|nr:Gfo/Idh/MocA family oxidoreductase [Gorillibacterium massiliense]